jgi:hypothetical protein
MGGTSTTLYSVTLTNLIVIMKVDKLQAVGHWSVTQRPDFDYRPVHVGFVLRVLLGQVFLQVLQSSRVSFIPPVLHTHSFIYHQHCIILAIPPLPPLWLDSP